MKKIILLSASLLVLAACTGTKLKKEYSSDNGGFSIAAPSIKAKTEKRNKKDAEVTTPAPTDNTNDNTTEPDAVTDNTSPPEDDTNQDTTPNQLNSNDVKGFDPFSGLYGPGT